jgi:hypothetical protein
MFDANKNEKIGRKAHIEAESKAGPRYNDKQTPKQRNSFENLIRLYQMPLEVKKQFSLEEKMKSKIS